MRYLNYRIQADEEQFSYRAYMTDAFRLMGENMAPSQRWADLFLEEQKDTRSGDEIVLDVLKRSGLVQRRSDV